MQIQQYGQRTPRLDRILITGGGNAGKTTLASKFASDISRTMYLSTDGNAAMQGYMCIVFEYPEKADEMLSQFKDMLHLAYKNKNTFDTIVWDLVEDIDEKMQVLLREEISNLKSAQRAWGKINMFYKFAHSEMMNLFKDKMIVLLSRDIEEYAKKDKYKDGKIVVEKGDVVGYIPALRKVLKNIILKDQSAEIRCYMEQGKRKFDIENLRFEEMRKKLNEIINSPVKFPSSVVADPKKCGDCKNEIKGTDKLTAEQVAHGTKEAYGIELCFDCGKKRKAGASA